MVLIYSIFEDTLWLKRFAHISKYTLTGIVDKSIIRFVQSIQTKYLF
jgi:hypothetical protein